MFRKKIASLTLVLMIAISASLPTMAMQYTDILPNNALSLDLELLTDLNIINGYPDGTFRPNQTINRAELLKVALKSTVKDEILEEYRYQNCFDDVENNQWYTPTICYARQSGIVSGYPGTNSFKPEQPVDAVEALKILFNAHNIEYQKVISPWYEGLLITSNDKYNYKPNPDHEITRGEVVKVLAAIIKENSVNITYVSNIEPSPQPPLEKNLQTIYETRPTDDEIAQIMNDFEINYIDSENEKWPEEFTFDQNSTEPSKMVIISHLNVLRQQEFSEPLPFTDGLSIYDYIKKSTKEFRLVLKCGEAHARSGIISLYKAHNVWDGRPTLQCDKALDSKIWPYAGLLHLIVHENEHSRPKDMGHIQCNGIFTDSQFENGGGYSQSAIYSMWVYKYGKFDPLSMKKEAKEFAKATMKTFCTPPTHSDPQVQAIIDELVAEIKAEGGSVIGY